MIPVIDSNFLLWLPDIAKFVSLFMSSKTSRREAPAIRERIGKPTTLQVDDQNEEIQLARNFGQAVQHALRHPDPGRGHRGGREVRPPRGGRGGAG